MTANKDFKRLVRERADRTGESYAKALRHLRARPPAQSSGDHKEKPVTIVRAVPDVRSNDLEASRAFYTDVLGFEVCMEQGDMVMFCSPSNSQAQVTVNGDGVPLPPGFLLDVGSPDRVTHLHDRSVRDGITVVEPLDDKPWGIRRFSLLDPNGTRITVLAHLEST